MSKFYLVLIFILASRISWAQANQPSSCEPPTMNIEGIGLAGQGYECSADGYNAAIEHAKEWAMRNANGECHQLRFSGATRIGFWSDPKVGCHHVAYGGFETAQATISAVFQCYGR